MSKVLHGKESFKEYSSQRIVLKDAELLLKFKGFMRILNLKKRENREALNLVLGKGLD